MSAPLDQAAGAGWAIRAHGVTKCYRDGEQRIDVLTGVELEVRAGEIVAVVGPSGSGKSTLLHLLGALDRPDDGTVEIAGQRLDRLRADQLADFRNRAIGFVFQFHQLLPDFDALENVAMPGRIAGWSRRQAERRAGGLLAEVGLDGRAGAFPSQLSGGERQRVALCRALLLEPPLLLADEPTGNLDPAAGDHVFELLLELGERRGATTVLVTHNPALANRCGRVLELRDGVLSARTAG
ncbi:MAG TPA: ABC transporter ATP-binding protein [Thermoanaerobaculia bacterium]|nr:ABC transporter ATP-binding protein [Thermoanaerobaculia bacterium]